MTTELPVPVQLELPPSWERVEPASLGVTNAALLAVRRGLDDDYHPTISVSGDWRTDGASAERIADESLALLTVQGAEDVELAGRRTVGGESAPSVLQTIGATAVIDGRRFDLRQLQVVSAFPDLEHPERQAVLIYTLSCTFAQYDAMGREFRAFMASVRVAPQP